MFDSWNHPIIIRSRRRPHRESSGNSLDWSDHPDFRAQSRTERCQMTTARKKLIEVALPLEAINKASAREKSIRHGHPSTLHLWWARRPLAAARAGIFSQMGGDPSGHTEKLRADSKLRRKAEAAL